MIRRTYATSPIRIGRPVSSSQHWRAFYELASELVESARALIPHTFLGCVLDAQATTGTFHFYIAPSLACDRRVLYLDIVSDEDPAPEFTVDVDGVEVGTGRASAGVRVPWSVEIDVTPSDTPVAVEVTIEVTGTVMVRTLGLFELPARELSDALTSMGVSGVGGLAPGSAIVETDALSVKGVWDLYHALDVRRAGLAHLAVAEERPIEITTAGAKDSWRLPPPCLPSILDANHIATAVAVWVLAKVAASSEATVTVTTEAGSTEAQTWVETSWTWKKIDVSLDCEDLSTTDGRRSARWEAPTVTLELVDGTQFDVAAVSVIRERVAGEQL